MSSVRRRAVVAGCAALAVAGATVATAASGGSSHVAAKPRHLPEECPRGTLPLPPDAVAGATEAALARVAPPAGEKDVLGARVVRAGLARTMDRGGSIRYLCGRRIQRRTIVVELLYTKVLPSASLSQGSMAVSRFPDGYRVWDILH
jgi:hypothetical protein